MISDPQLERRVVEPLLIQWVLVIQFLVLPILDSFPPIELLRHHPIPQEPYDQDYSHAKGVISTTCDSSSGTVTNSGST